MSCELPDGLGELDRFDDGYQGGECEAGDCHGKPIEPPTEPQPGMAMINIATAETPLGEPVMSDSGLAVFVSAFKSTGFTGSINWYRNLCRNWRLLADVDPIIQQRTLMIYGDRDPIARSENLTEFVPNVDVITLDCGHWIQKGKPEETNQAILNWLEQQSAASDSSLRT